MHNRLSSGARLGRQALLFPLCLVLYEFSTYIGNDMIQPGMLAVVEQYQAGLDWVPTSMTAYRRWHVFAVVIRTAIGSYWSSAGDVNRCGVVHCYLPCDAVCAEH